MRQMAEELLGEVETEPFSDDEKHEFVVPRLREIIRLLDDDSSFLADEHLATAARELALLGSGGAGPERWTSVAQKICVFSLAMLSFVADAVTIHSVGEPALRPEIEACIARVENEAPAIAAGEPQPALPPGEPDTSSD